MSHLDKINEQYETGLPIFLSLFELKSKELKEKLKEIVGDKLSNRNEDFFSENSSVCKTIKDDQPDELEVYFYSSLKINAFGINYKPEHGKEEKIVAFDKFFKL